MSSSSEKPMRARMSEYIEGLQDEIISSLEKLDPSAPRFIRDSWQRPEGGYGISSIFQVPYGTNPSPAPILEKAGVNISVVHGHLPPPAIKQMRVEHASIPYDPGSTTALPFFAAGISLIIHPRNPHAPTVHANYRYFEIADANEKDKVIAWWFGGGSDLTPSYLYDEDAVHFHKTIKEACDKHGTLLHSAFKKWCDEYFYIPHRKESRGVGGLFFDDLCLEPHKRLAKATSPDDTQSRPWTPDDIFAFVRSAGDSFLPSYIPILEKRARMETNDEERRWQLLRRGRYVEFNLVYDRGTKFGLMTPGARIESILVSLPETARWEYMTDMGTLEGSEEKRLLEVLQNPKEWV